MLNLFKMVARAIDMTYPVNAETGQVVDNHRKSRKVREDHPNARLTQEQVNEIRRLAGEGVSTAMLVERFGVGKTAINDIKTGKTWKPLNLSAPTILKLPSPETQN